MSNYIGSVPDTKRKPDWRDRAACSGDDTEVYFSALSEETAKTVCRSCPVVEECLQFAFDEDIPFGIYGGLTEDERRAVRRASTRRELTPECVRPEHVAGTTERGRPKRTLRSLWNQHAQLLDDGHVGWTGSTPIKLGGKPYTPTQISFRLDRGRPPVGIIRHTCGTTGCILPAHLADQQERDERDLCGSRPGYQRHLKRGEPACGRCREANTDADNRLRRTGTTLPIAG